MGRLAIAFLLVAAGLLLLGCVEQITGRDKVRAQCAAQLASCQDSCDERASIFGTEECKRRCSTDYDTCLTK